MRINRVYYIYAVCVRDGYRQCHSVLLYYTRYIYLPVCVCVCVGTAHTHNGRRYSLDRVLQWMHRA